MSHQETRDMRRAVPLKIQKSGAWSPLFKSTYSMKEALATDPCLVG